MLEKFKNYLAKGLTRFNQEAPPVNIGGSMDTFFHNLMGLESSAFGKAQVPSNNHPWIFATANMTALVASQAPFKIYHETEDTIKKRRAFAKKNGRAYRPSYGGDRLAYTKYCDISVSKRLTTKSLEEDFEHPISVLFNRPNPFQSKTQFFYSLIALASLEGSCYVIKLGEDRLPVSTDTEVPKEVWPISVDCFEPIFVYSKDENKVLSRWGWKFKSPSWFPMYKYGTDIYLPEYTVAEFVKPNPSNPTIGLSPLTPLAGTLVTDFLIEEINRKLLSNGAVPSGALVGKGSIQKEQRDAMRQEWQERHSGSHNAGSLMILSNMEFKALGLSPTEMAFKDTLTWNREKELAVTNTPASVLGITEFTNYATQLGQDRNFWDKNLIPLLKMIEASFDKNFLGGYSDQTVGMFDLSGVEALRIGLINQIRGAERLCGQALHFPPELALRLMGVTVERYDGDEISIPLETFRSGEKDKKQQQDQADQKPPVGVMEDPEAAREETDAPQKAIKARGGAYKGASASNTLSGLTYDAMLGKVSKAYEKWVTRIKEEALSSEFLKIGTKEVRLDIGNILPNISELLSSLSTELQPIYTEIVARISSGIAAELSTPIYDLRLDNMSEFIVKHQQVVLKSIAEGTHKRLLKGLTKGLGDADNILEFRDSLKKVFDAEITKAEDISKTFTSTTIQGLQWTAYVGQGFSEFEWEDLDDDIVRDTHRVFGASGPHPKGFNYLSLVGEEGTLEFPGDLRAPKKEFIHCRCNIKPIR